MRLRLGIGLLAATVVALDQLTKYLVRDAWRLGEGVELGPWLELQHVKNTGLAFGFLSGTGNAVILGSIVAAVVLLVLVGRIPAHDRWTSIGLGLLAGGAIGNLIDRVFRGSVTDFIDPIWFPAFNVADIGITVGVVCVLIGQFRIPAASGSDAET